MLHTTLDLNFETLALSQHAPDLISKRIKFHLQQESIVSQVRWMTEKLLLTRQLASPHLSGHTHHNDKIKRLDSPLKVGILLHDIFPETSENLCWAILNHLFYGELLCMDQIEIISRRKNLVNFAPPQFEKLCVSWSFTNSDYIQRFDLIVICGSSMDVPMLQELFSNQNLYQTIVMMTIPGILMQRIQSILNSELVVMCNFSAIDSNIVDRVRNVIRMDNLPLNLVFPDLELLNRYLTTYCLRSGLKTQQSADVAAKVLPKNQIKAKEEVEAKKLPRLVRNTLKNDQLEIEKILTE